MPPKITVEMTADEQRLFRAFAKLQAQQERMEQKLGQTGRTGQRAGRNIRRGFDPAILNKFIGAIGLGGGVLGVLRLISAELDVIKTRQKEAFDVQAGVVSGRQEIVRNLANAPTEVVTKGSPAAILSTNRILIPEP